jgi:hypothetical protein
MRERCDREVGWGRNVQGHRRRQSVCCLLSSRRHAEAKSVVGPAALCELSRTNLGGEGVARRIGENL